MDRLGDAERAAVGDPTRRLVGVDPVDLDEGIREVVRAGDDVEQAGREFRWVGGRVGVAVVGDRLDLERGDPARLGGAQLGVDVVVPGERVGLQVLGAILDPLDRLAGQEGGRHGQDVARIDRDLAAEAAADVMGLDPDVLLIDRQAGPGRHEREHGPDGVRRLARHVERQLLADRVPVGDAAACLDGGDVDPGDVDVLADPDLGGLQRGVRAGLVARLPVPDVVVGLVRPSIGAQHEGTRLQGLHGVDDDGQRLVVDLDRGDAVGRRIARGGDDGGHFLRLVHDRVDRQHHLHIAGQRGHPGEFVALQVLAGDHRRHARDLERLGRVDGLDLGVRVRRADDVQPELAGQVEVLDVLALALDEAGVLLALDGVAHAPHFGRRVGRDLGHRSTSPQPARRPRPAWPASRRPPAGRP